MKVKFFAPSYKRPEKSITQKTYPFVKLVVKESEAKSYTENGNDIVVCPDNIQGNLCRVRNWILDNLFDDADCIVIIDDDCRYVGRWEKQKRIKFNQNQLYNFCVSNSILCKELDFKFWGCNIIEDKKAYKEYIPISFLSYIGGPFQAHLKDSEIRYDENLPLKEDYDITLQHIKKYGGCMRVNYSHYMVKQAEQVGGCSTYRNTETEKEQFFTLQKKWGKDVIQRDKNSKRSFDFNPVMKVPIKGM
jgi:hypothetical protein